MRGISCLVNFKNNLTKNIPYYDLLIRQISGDSEVSNQNPCICEQVALFSKTGSIVSKICEGYQFTIAFWGNILNAEDLKNELSGFGYHFLSNKDSELVLSCYIHFGENCAQKLCGNFAFIIYDAMRRQIFALSDASGSMPIFYSKTEDDYVLSSSLKGIFSHPGLKKRISSSSLLELLSCQNRIPDCIFEDVYTLTPCSFLKISKSGIKTGKYTPLTACQSQNDIADVKNAGVILSGSTLDIALLESLTKKQEKECLRTSVYAEKFSDDLGQFSTKNQHLLVDDGTVSWALESVISACGFPFMSNYDYLLPIALKRAKGNGETLFFAAPDRFDKKRDYISTLLKNDAFYRPLAENMKEYTPSGDNFPPYSFFIADSFESTLKIPFFHSNIYNEETLMHTVSPKIRTSLRHVLLDIISKENSPIIAFFKRSALLRLCEGGFVFCENESESELIAYLIKLNMWFEKTRPQII